MRKLLPLLGMACLLSGCVVYPNGAIGPAPISVAPVVVAPAYAYGYGYNRPYSGWGHGPRWGYGGAYGRRW